MQVADVRHRPWTTDRWGLSRGEWVTTAAAAAVSSAGYVAGGHTYLARGVVGDLAGFVLLGVAGLLARRRVRHEALVCLTLVGAVVALRPRWPLALAEPTWWAVFAAALTAYLVLRARLCAGGRDR